MSEEPQSHIVQISSVKFLSFCVLAALSILGFARGQHIPAWIIGCEVLVVIFGLFIFGSIRYRIDKNALTYGSMLIVGATFWINWWPDSHLRLSMIKEGPSALAGFLGHYLLTLHGLDELVHGDTMLFILGLTFFVAVIAQTRMLESISFTVLKKTKGSVLITVAILTGLVSFASGILDGVSMIGLMIRTLVIILFLAKARDNAVLFAVIVSTIITTVCGMWLAYGEPPNLIMKANLHPHLTNAFFLRYCLPVAVGSYLVIYWNLRKYLKGQRVDVEELDVIDLQTADVRFLQASKHGEVLTPIEFVEEHRNQLGSHFEPVLKKLHVGEPLGKALVAEQVPEPVRKELMGKFVSEELAVALDRHYTSLLQSGSHSKDDNERRIDAALSQVRNERRRAQWIGALSFAPFIGFLIWHGIDHSVPLFWASFAGFAVAYFAVAAKPKMRQLALKEARHEFAEYLFLLPLFLSITLLQKSGFFNQLAELLHQGIERMGIILMAYLQFTGATLLSAMLDNNIVADFASRALHGLEITVLHLFAVAQIAGYAVGGCWTHIGSAQSVVSYAFIRKEVDEHFTPFQWIKMITPIILEIFVLVAVILYGESLLARSILQ